MRFGAAADRSRIKFLVSFCRQTLGRERKGSYLKILTFLNKLLFPGACPICGQVQEQRVTGDGVARICPDCEKKVRRVLPPFCLKCGKPLGRGGECREYCGDCARQKHFFVQGRAVFVYGSVVRGMYRMKYGNRRDFSVTFAREAYIALGDWIRHVQPQALIPVPLHPSRRRKRGYNQAELLARELSRLTGIPLERSLVKRSVRTRPQKELNTLERKNNLKNAFQMSKNSVHLIKVLLIDDIYTTGSTADALAETLMGAGIEKVYVLCICIGGDDQGGLDDGSKDL